MTVDSIDGGRFRRTLDDLVENMELDVCKRAETKGVRTLNVTLTIEPKFEVLPDGERRLRPEIKWKAASTLPAYVGRRALGLGNGSVILVSSDGYEDAAQMTLEGVDNG